MLAGKRKEAGMSKWKEVLSNRKIKLSKWHKKTVTTYRDDGF